MRAGTRWRATWIGPAVVAVLALLVRLLHLQVTAKGFIVDDAEFFQAHAQHFLAAWAAAGTAGAAVFWPALRDAVDHASLQGILYPLTQSLVYAAAGIANHGALRFVQAVLGAASAWLTFLAARRAFGAVLGPVTGGAAGLAVALYPPLVLASGLLLAEAELVFLQSLALYLLVRGLAPDAPGAGWSRFLGGVCAGLLMLRPALQYTGPLLLLALLAAGGLRPAGRPTTPPAPRAPDQRRNGDRRPSRALGPLAGQEPPDPSDPWRGRGPRLGTPVIGRRLRGWAHDVAGARGRLRGAAALAAPYLAGVLVVALPWVMVNGLVYGSFVWSRTGDAWQQIYWGIYPPNRGWWPPDSPVPPKYGVESLPGAWAAGAQIEPRDLDYLEAAVDQVRATPLKALATEVNKLYQVYLHPFNAYGESPALVGALAVPLHRVLVVLTLAGLALAWLRPAAGVVLAAGLFAAALPLLASHVDLRYTIPPAQAAAPFAGLAVAVAVDRLGADRARFAAPRQAGAAGVRTLLAFRHRKRLVALLALVLPIAVWTAGVPWIVWLAPGVAPWHAHLAHAALMCLALLAAGTGAGYLLAAGPADGAPDRRFVASGAAAGAVLALVYGIQALYDGDWHQWLARLPAGAAARQAIILPGGWVPPPGGRAELRLYLAGSRAPTYEPVVRVDGHEVARLGPAFADAGPLRFWARIMVAARNQGKTRAEVPQWYVVPLDAELLRKGRLDVELAVEAVGPPAAAGAPTGLDAPDEQRGWVRLWGDYAPRPGARVHDGPAVYSRIPGADEAFLKFLATGEYGIWRWTPLSSPSAAAAWRRGAGWDAGDLSDAPGRQTGEYRIRLLVFGPGGDLLGLF